ncbi:hypothetical protein Ciccas_008969 [Cichlidogyrus casuarinus]|uniref:Fibronectin type-III domain-containing protein n=1 Tax=Cichlidogyrus casuarinus TaxID=1844966 RepID=A0ABD2Q2S3_9PLAT
MNAPQGLAKIFVNSNSVAVSWTNLVPIGTEIVTGYRVQYQKHIQATGTGTVLAKDVENNFATISSLDPCTLYLVSVAGVDNITDPGKPVVGPYSLPIFIRTYAPVPTGSVTGAVATVQGSGSAYITITDLGKLACTHPETGNCGQYYYRVSLVSGATKYIAASVTTPSFGWLTFSLTSVSYP